MIIGETRHHLARISMLQLLSLQTFIAVDTFCFFLFFRSSAFVSTAIPPHISTFPPTIEAEHRGKYSDAMDRELNMLVVRKHLSVVLCLCLLLIAATPAFAADPQVSKKDLKGISAKKHKYAFAVIGGAAVGAGIGALFGSGNDALKGIMIGGGGVSLLYLHSHRHDPIAGWRTWANIGSWTAFGGGTGWLLCGCNDGLVSGLLIGGGGSAIYASHQASKQGTAQTPRNP